MFAVVRERTPGTGVGGDHLAEFRRVRAQQPGYRGIVEVADEDGRILSLALSLVSGKTGRPGRRDRWSSPPGGASGTSD